ncbi:MAG: PQQ-binding-like beta-propeller repeat protein [Acidobacteria bacterium]|nr:PQQ-binding-like beta-propeller repeat protein [Acidobacteriota bacterium]NIM62474.1 PQQ-binding-like beta-propeller repeat protein [Acidobacteriota bacterium]NIO59032.1 PQQ-binding-like beta-propeller repeat protein [Acidobacteriota bacterium]NIQ29297.1 PQQ-binding-like beta-propeller repeat protein [Acidobacteriota bacterium]NIQ86440.1 PQQ-binding-like beta-propeller repeat protein [Acidobacteriota bacterium]
MKRIPLSCCLALVALACGSTDPVGDGLPPSTEEGATPAATQWPGFGGPAGDFRVRASGIADGWPEGGPVERWSHPLGAGYSTISVLDGLLYVTSREADQDIVQARNTSDGTVVWEQRYDAPARDGQTVDFGTGPNASPLVDGERVFTLSFAGDLYAFDRTTGDLLWRRQLLDDFGAELLDFGFSASPIFHEGKLIVLAGGEQQGALALDPASGDVIWKGSPSSVSYSTPIVIDVDGQRQLVYFSADKIIGLDVADGSRLWDFPVLNQYRNNSTAPVWGTGNLLWVPTQLDGGTRVLRLTRDGGETRVEEVWSSTKMSVHFWNTLRLGDAVFASIGGNGSIVAAIDLTDGEILWRQRGFEKVNFVHAGDKTILLDAKGKLALARLSPENVEILAEATIANETTWSAPTLVGTTLYYRDQSSVRAFDLGAGAD